MDDIKIKRALIAVYDKTGIVEFARALVDEFGIEIISTGGTAKHLKGAGIPVTMVEQVTGMPEMLDGRVKTLHPKIHAAILADRDKPDHMRQLAEHGIEPIDMVVVNLYPFEQTIAKPGCTFEEAIEMIDIGGPCMLRAAAKNHRGVLVVSGGVGYEQVLLWLRGKPAADAAENADFRRDCAMRAFAEVNHYDGKIVGYLTEGAFRQLSLWTQWPARYGENPHQSGEQALLAECALGNESSLVRARRLANPELSFNNYVDGDSALSLVKELSRAGISSLWHRRPAGDSSLCGTGVSPVENPTSAWHAVDEERVTRRNLPHIQVPGHTYFVTFRIKSGELSPEARTITLSACRCWHGKKLNLHAAVVMPDHVHLLLTPYETEAGQAVALGELLHSIKSYSAHEIAKLTNVTGAVWLDENWDRVIRNEKEFAEKREYIETNPDRAGLGSQYRWRWTGDAGFQEGGQLESDRWTAGATVNKEEHRRDAGATKSQDETPAGRRCHKKEKHTLADELFAVAFIKHTNACGVAIGDDPVDTYRRAYLGDPIAAAGGVLCVNFPVTREFADVVMNSFGSWGKAAGAAFFKLDVWIAPSFDEDAVKLITTPTEKRKWGASCRLLAVGPMDVPLDANEMDYKKITGGMLVQTRDLVGLNEGQWKVVSKRQPAESEISDLRFAWLVCKHTKSNAITIVRDGMLLGNGAGQMSRVKSCDLAVQLARENGHGDKLAGAVAAGDAFFPVEDGPTKLLEAGITAMIHPGGSNRDADSIRVCDEAGAAMIMTGTRHFKH
jgi:AICAR transformylase/IMP cyclohydrolase PurH/REP element-mobilizing transposase RayT